MEHYSVRGKELNIFRSFFKDRRQYVSIDSMESELKDACESSCIQGSKMSSLLYVLYTNEIPFLSNLMNTELYSRITNTNDIIQSSVKCYTIQYVDDSTNMLSTKNIDQLQNYVDKYFKLLENYYNINKLSLNQEKSKYMIICKPSMRAKCSNLVMKTTNHIIEQANKIKVLGIFISSSLSNIPTINNIIFKVNFRLYTLKKSSNILIKEHQKC